MSDTIEAELNTADFLTRIGEVMKEFGVDNCLVVYGFNNKVENTLLIVKSNEHTPFYEHLSEGISRYTASLSIKAQEDQN